MKRRSSMTHSNVGKIKFLLESDLSKEMFISIIRSSKFDKYYQDLVDFMLKLKEEDKKINAANLLIKSRDIKLLIKYIKLVNDFDKEKHQ